MYVHVVTKHLVLEETLPDQQRRYVMLDAVRAYVEERLAKSRERLQVEADLAAYNGQLAQAADEALKGPEQAVWLNRLHEEQPNFRLALMRLLDGASMRLPLNLVPAFLASGTCGRICKKAAAG
jgi:hypothetical protein